MRYTPCLMNPLLQDATPRQAATYYRLLRELSPAQRMRIVGAATRPHAHDGRGRYQATQPWRLGGRGSGGARGAALRPGRTGAAMREAAAMSPPPFSEIEDVAVRIGRPGVARRWMGVYVRR